MKEIADDKYLETAIRLWEEPREQVNTLLVQRSGFDKRCTW